MLRRKVYEDIRFALSIDPALDMSDAEYEAYRSSGWDASKLKLKPGEQPTWWRAAQLTDRQKMACHRSAHAVDTADMAIRYGLRGVEGYMIEDSAGNVVELESPQRVPSELGDMVPQSWFDKARLLTEEKLSLGASILALSEARPPLSRPSV